MDTKSYTAGASIFSEGEPSEHAYRILAGEVEISMQTSAGPVILAHLHEGEIFGEMGLVADRPRSASAKALTETQVEVVDEVAFHEVILRDPAKLEPYVASLFERLRTTDALLQLELNKRAGEGAGKGSFESALAPAGGRGPGSGAAPSLHIASCYQETGWVGTPVDATVSKFPFRIGRQHLEGKELALRSNDLLLRDDLPLNVSRHHCSIERAGDRFIVVDRGSTLGTVVNGERIGTEQTSLSAALKDGENEMILGAEDSPHRFKLVVS